MLNINGDHAEPGAALFLEKLFRSLQKQSHHGILLFQPASASIQGRSLLLLLLIDVLDKNHDNRLILLSRPQQHGSLGHPAVLPGHKKLPEFPSYGMVFSTQALRQRIKIPELQETLPVLRIDHMIRNLHTHGIQASLHGGNHVFPFLMEEYLIGILCQV